MRAGNREEWIVNGDEQFLALITILDSALQLIMFARFRERSNDLEHLDIGDYTPEEYEGCIVELQRVNQWLGDAR
ncbi:MAG: hypothetical protein LC776_18190, partial [Acidobacteria bacterium]|nr:hypothetical protein [Acidobacteriota bacterium]